MDPYPQNFFTRGVRFFFLAAVLGSCSAPAVDAVCAVPAEGTVAQQAAAVCACQNGIAEVPIPAYRRKKIDLLLVVGNTAGMAAKQQALAESLAFLPRSLALQDYDYHIGVVSTDVGSWITADTPWTMSAGACDSFAGDDGKLQTTSCLDRGSVSAAAAGACAALCPDRKFLPTDGRAYLARENGKTNVPSSLEPDAMTGQLIDRGPEYAFKCMTILGDAGCTISAPLESARRALDGHLLQNSGFLRPDSLLAVLFLTDEDDCSLQLSRRAEGDPHTQSCVVPDPAAAATCYGLGPYRCLARDVACDQPMNTAGLKTNCHERADSALESVDTYARFFASLHSPFRTLLLGIWTLPALGNGGQLTVEQDPKVGGSAGLVLGRGNNAGCQSAGSPLITGSAQLRLASFVASLSRELGESPSDFAESVSVCAPTAYAQAVLPLATSIGLGRVASCLPGLPRLRPDGSPLCEVGDVAIDFPAATPAVPMPLCDSGCCTAFANSASARPSGDPVIAAACAAEPADCYCAVVSNVAGICPGGARLGVWRKDNAEAPPDSVTSLRCATQCALGTP